MEQLKIEYLPIDELTPYENNAREHGEPDIKAIASSIKEFGFLDPIGVWGENNLIVEGHGRLLAARHLRMKEVPVIRLDQLTDEQRRAYALAHNKTAELSGWDFIVLDSELAGIEQIDMTKFGFDFDDPDIETATSDDGYEPKPPDVPKSKRGDIYALGEHRLICGDSTSTDDIEKLMDGGRADIVITSPPYGMGGSAKIHDHYVKGQEQRKSFYSEYDDNPSEWRDLIYAAYDVMAMHSDAQFINVQMLADNKQDLIEFVHDHRDILCDVIVWDKTKAPPQMAANVLNNQFEFVFIFGNKNRTVPFGDFHGTVNNVIEQPTGRNEYSEVHNAVYPVELPARLIEIASKAESVFDPFGGTGTTLIACEQKKRKCYMCELDPKYVDVIIDRWETFTGEKAVLLNG